MNAKATPINDNDPYNSCRTCLTNRMESIYIKPLVINSLGFGHTHILTIRTGSILRNQARAGLGLVPAWFKNKSILGWLLHMTWICGLT